MTATVRTYFILRTIGYRPASAWKQACLLQRKAEQLLARSQLLNIWPLH